MQEKVVGPVGGGGSGPIGGGDKDLASAGKVSKILENIATEQKKLGELFNDLAKVVGGAKSRASGG